jgi:hypothetical protein
MRSVRAFLAALFLLLGALAAAPAGRAQNGNSANIAGTVTDPSGAVVVGATVTIHNPVSQYERSTTTDSSGAFSFPNVPFNPYHLSVAANGFGAYAQDVDVRSSVPLAVKVSLTLAGSSSTVTVEGGGDLVENDPTFHTDVDRALFDKLPLESQSSSLSSLVTLTTPGIAADSNGLFHGLGDHAENSFSVDGQPITDQQSKVFSNQLPVDAIQSLEVISGAPPAEFGDKTSVVIQATTRSGLGVTTPHGSIFGSYGAFGTSNAGFDLAYGTQKWGNFISVSGLNTGRFLDPPEFTVMHDKGNEENIFDRVDYQVSTADSIHFNAQYTRSWFQTPNSFDAENATAWNGVVVANSGLDPNGFVVGPTDQRSKIGTFNIAPSWTHILSPNAVFTLGAFVRHDGYNYYPSNNPFADLGPPSLQRQSVSQFRTLTNAGVRSDLSYSRGINNIKVGVVYEQTFLREHDNVGIVDPTFNAPCLSLATAPNPDVPVQGFTDPSQCAAAGFQANVSTNPNAPASTLFPLFNPVLLPFDLTRGGTLFNTDASFPLHADVKQLAMYVQDTIAGKTGPLISASAAICTGVCRMPPRQSRDLAWPTTSSHPTPSCGFPMRELSKLPLTKTSCFPASDACPRSSIRCSPAERFHPNRSARVSATNFMRASNRRSANISCWTANTSGSTRTTATTSACSATRPSPSRSSGTMPRSQDSRCAEPYPTFMD